MTGTEGASEGLKKIVVVTAFACDPNLPSEPTIGWSFLRAIMDECWNDDRLEVVAYMNERSKKATDLRLKELGLIHRVTTVGVHLSKWLRFLEHPSLTRIETLAWCRSTSRLLRSLSKSREIILARHVTFASELLPTPIASLTDKTLRVWGPVGCSGQAGVFLIHPRHKLWRFQYLLQRLRDLVSSVLSASIARNVDVVVATSEQLAKHVENSSTQGIVFPNTTLDDGLLELIRSTRSRVEATPFDTSAARALNMLCVGNLVPLKRFELAINALTDPRLLNAKLVIIGKPAAGRPNYLIGIAEKLGVIDRVTFLGQVPRSEVVARMFEADVLFHPSTREGGSGVVGEAATVGLPVVCFGGTGASVVLESSRVSGMVLPPRRNLGTADIATALVAAAEKPRIPSAKWNGARYRELEHGLIEMAWAQSGADLASK